MIEFSAFPHASPLPVISNQTSWAETTAEVIVVPAGADGGFSCANLQALVDQYRTTQLKIASITACSNVTGIQVCWECRYPPLLLCLVLFLVLSSSSASSGHRHSVVSCRVVWIHFLFPLLQQSHIAHFFSFHTSCP
jgi:hypothetical protein